MSAYLYIKANTKLQSNTAHTTIVSQNNRLMVLTTIYDRFHIFKGPYPHLRNDRSLHSTLEAVQSGSICTCA